MSRLSQIHKIAIVGAGTMGQGIAQVCAMADYEVLIYDLDEKMLGKAIKSIEANLNKGIEKGKVSPELRDRTMSNIKVISNSDELVADLIIEAIIENLEVKLKLFQDLEQQNSVDTILASNTSSIPITRIAAALKRPQNFVGMHFFNPAHIMKLVEVISGVATDSAVADTIYELALKLDKVPVHAKDAPGFIVNRVARHFYVEGLKVLEERVSDVNGIDRLVESSGFKMGPFRLMDLIGVETNYSVTESMFNAFHQDSKFRPSRIQQQKVDAGHYGRKSGQGFYKYD